MSELSKRIFTSLFLILIVFLSFYYFYIFIILLILISVLAWIEFNGLIKKIYLDNLFKTKILSFLFKLFFLIYMVFFSTVVFDAMNQNTPNAKLNLIYLLLICICSDVGGFIFGKTFKGKKLTNISPNKTIIGAVGSFILPLFLVPFFYKNLNNEFSNLTNLLLLVFLVSLVCQLGDLSISYLKRKANVKDTSDLLPGHGGILDRVDGIIFALPFGIILWDFLINFV